MNSLKFYADDKPIQVISASFSQNTGQWLTTFNFTLSGVDDFDYLGQHLVYSLGSQDYHLIIDDSGAGKTTKGLTRTISGRALTVLLDAPYSDRIVLQTWRNVMFSELVAELCDAANIGVQFQISDFFIREYTAAKKTLIEIIKELANDARVSIQTSLNGQFLIICYKFKTTPKLLSTAVAQAITRIFSVSQTLENVENFDALLVLTELAAQKNATVEQKVINNYIRARVFLPNWSDTPPTLTHYDSGNVTVEYQGIKTIQKVFEDVAIELGTGKIDAGASLVSHKSYCKSLGSLTIQPDGTLNTSIVENGLIRVVALVKCHEFKLTSTCCDKARFDVFEPANQLTKIPEIRINDGDKYAEPIVIKYFDDSAAMIAAGTQALIDLQDFESYSLKTDHWDDLPLPCDLVEFDNKKGYCAGFSVNVSSSGITADLTVKVPV